MGVFIGAKYTYDKNVNGFHNSYVFAEEIK